MFILSALELRGPFHAAKVRTIMLMCNCFAGNLQTHSARYCGTVAVTGVTAGWDIKKPGMRCQQRTPGHDAKFNLFFCGYEKSY